MTELTSVDIALNHILKHTQEIGDKTVVITQCLGRVLAKDIFATEDLPPFANSSMDGYAVRAEDIAQASPDTPVTLKVVMDIPAGHAPEQPLKHGEAARIMTGAPMPEGADAVIPVEDTDSDWQKQTLTPLPEHVRIFRAIEAGAYVRQIGENVKKGDFVLPKGRELKPQDIGMLAGLGIANVTVKRKPKVAIISTGDELIGVDEPLSPGKIRNSNSYTLAGMVIEAGGEAVVLPKAADTLDAVR
ncbi:MAG: molybdopterin molybdenumtransferase MoeA, partial [Chloroflexi bacterium]